MTAYQPCCSAPFNPLTTGGRRKVLLLRRHDDDDEDDDVDEWVVIASILLSLGGYVFNMPQFSLFL